MNTELYGEMIKILMEEDGLDLNQAHKVISDYYNISVKELRKLLLDNKEYKKFAYDILFYNKDEDKWITRFQLSGILNKIKEELAPFEDDLTPEILDKCLFKREFNIA